jgi:hypothetical protein
MKTEIKIFRPYNPTPRQRRYMQKSTQGFDGPTHPQQENAMKTQHRFIDAIKSATGKWGIPRTPHRTYSALMKETVLKTNETRNNMQTDKRSHRRQVIDAFDLVWRNAQFPHGIWDNTENSNERVDMVQHLSPFNKEGRGL